MSHTAIDRASIRAQLIDYLVRFTNKPELRDVSDLIHLDEYGLDSLAIFEYVMGLEKEFDITFEDQHFTIANFQTLGSTVDLVYETLRRSAAPGSH
jgi:acyl carrier protein